MVDDMGHWKPGSSMSRVYNAIPTSRELMGRSRIVKALQVGWRPAPEGVALSEFIPLVDEELPEVPSRKRRRKEKKAKKGKGVRQGARPGHW